MSESVEVTLAFFRSDGERRDFPLARSVTTLGRGKKSHLRIPLRSVSRIHAQIEIREDGVFIRDLGSSNGTRLNGKRVVEARLRPGSRISLGWAHFVVVIDGVPAEVDPVPTVRPDSAKWKDGTAMREAVDQGGEKGGGKGGEQGRVDRSKPISLGPASDMYTDDEEDPITALESLSTQDSWKPKDIEGNESESGEGDDVSGDSSVETKSSDS